eukprot:43542_1
MTDQEEADVSSGEEDTEMAYAEYSTEEEDDDDDDEDMTDQEEADVSSGEEDTEMAYAEYSTEEEDDDDDDDEEYDDELEHKEEANDEQVEDADEAKEEPDNCEIKTKTSVTGKALQYNTEKVLKLWGLDNLVMNPHVHLTVDRASNNVLCGRLMVITFTSGVLHGLMTVVGGALKRITKR